MHARYYWTNFLLGAACAFFWRETPELRKPKPETPEEDGTLTAFLRWLLGIEPKHWRRFLLVPIFWLLTGWFPLHVALNAGPKVRRVRP